MDTIFVHGLRAAARVGVKPNEQRREQLISLDLELESGVVPTAAASDRLRDTVDYERMADLALAVIRRGHYRLVEALATTIAEELLSLPGVVRARVRLHKLHCLTAAESAGVEVQLERPPSACAPLSRDHVSRSAEAAEVVVAGGGVAGIATALWCWRLGHPALLLEPAPRLGGQLHQVHAPMPDIPGLPALSGAELLRSLERQFAEHGGRWLRARLTSASVTAEGCQLSLADADGGQLSLPARTLVLACGLRRRSLGVPGERRLAGRGLLQTAARTIAQLRGERVVVVGGGDAAYENALKLADVGARVTLVQRGARSTARAQFARAVAAAPRVELLRQRQVSAFDGEEHLEAVRLDDGSALAARWALVRVGWLPNTEGLPARWIDERGFLRCDERLRVNGERRVFAAGDARAPAAPSVAVSSGDGAVAARGVQQLLEGR